MNRKRIFVLVAAWLLTGLIHAQDAPIEEYRRLERLSWDRETGIMAFQMSVGTRDAEGEYELRYWTPDYRVDTRTLLALRDDMTAGTVMPWVVIELMTGVISIQDTLVPLSAWLDRHAKDEDEKPDPKARRQDDQENQARLSGQVRGR